MLKEHLAQYSLQCAVAFCVAGALFFMGLISTAHAQVARFQASDISINLEPENPEAFTDVEITLKTFAIDLDIHYIIWNVNGSEHKAGYGEKSAVVRTSNYGEATNVEALIQSQDGRVVRKNIVLRPATVDLLWEAVDAYVPPFYQGKALPARGAVLKVTAIPNLVVEDTFLDHNELDYTWKWNHKNKASASGYNKQFMGIKNNFLNHDETVSVEVQNTQGTIRGEGIVKMDFYDPELVFYKTHPQTNRYNLRQALSGIVSAGSEPLALGVAPYFFSVRPNQTIDSLLYAWQANDTSIAADKTANKIVLSIAPGGAGTTKLEVGVQQPEEDFQSKHHLLNIVSK